MISSKSLRIGNSVFKDGIIHSVTKDDFKEETEGLIVNIDPIQLTPELFEKIDTTLINQYKGSFIFHTEPGSDKYSFFYQVNGKARRINFFHELQNIIYDLSEKELQFL